MQGGHTPLLLAMLHKDGGIVNFLAENLKPQDLDDIEALSDKEKTSRLHLAAAVNSVLLSEKLIQANCKMDIRDEDVRPYLA